MKKLLFAINVFAMCVSLTQAQTAISVGKINNIRFTDQYPGATPALRATAALSSLGSSGLAIIPSNEVAGAIPVSIPAGTCLMDLRNTTGSGQINVVCNPLSSFQSQGVRVNITGSPDGINGTAIIGDATAAGSGANIMGVLGQVSSSGSAGVDGLNFGSGGHGGPGVQGDVVNLPDAIGILGVAGGTNATTTNPHRAVAGKCGVLGAATNPAGTCFGLYGENSNGLALYANNTASAASGVDPMVALISSSLNSSTDEVIRNLSSGFRWDFRVSGSADPLTASPGMLSLYNQTSNLLPFTIAANATNLALQVANGGVTINGGTLLPTSNTTGTGSIVLSAGGTVSNQTINLGVAGNGSGFKHKRGTGGCATAASVGATCTTTVTWTTPFADANYTAGCSGRLVSSGVPVIGADTSHLAASITVTTVATTTAAAQFTAVDCWAYHD